MQLSSSFSLNPNFLIFHQILSTTGLRLASSHKLISLGGILNFFGLPQQNLSVVPCRHLHIDPHLGMPSSHPSDVILSHNEALRLLLF